MQAELAKAPDSAVGNNLSVIRDVMRDYHPRDFAVRFWDGTTWDAEPGIPARFTLVINHPAVLEKILRKPDDLTLGEAYIYNDIDVEGDMESAFSLADYLSTHRPGILQRLRIGGHLLALRSRRRRGTHDRAAELKGVPHSKKRDRQAVTYHYDVSNGFYALWLDSRMVYSCAYFQTDNDSLETAQEHKLDYICRKLRVRPGERLLDIGCGWGALVMHAAQRYGAQALGITLSGPQAELANSRIREAGLDKQCSVEVMDYRDMTGLSSYDKLASVGMFEHVGESRMGKYFKSAWNLLRPGGLFLNHAIGCPPEVARIKGPTFSTEYVFPDGELLPIGQTLRGAEEAGFEVRDVESLREHYALTLRRWASRLEARREEAVRITDETTYRIWRLYMNGCAHRFKTGVYNVYQTLLVKPDRGKSGLPLTRSDWYG